MQGGMGIGGAFHAARRGEILRRAKLQKELEQKNNYLHSQRSTFKENLYNQQSLHQQQNKRNNTNNKFNDSLEFSNEKDRSNEFGQDSFIDDPRMYSPKRNQMNISR